MYKILIVCDIHEFPVRRTIWESLYAFERYSNERTYILNLAVQKFTKRWRKIALECDVIIFHTTFLSSRWDPSLFARNVERIDALKLCDAVKVVLPQDEFIYAGLLCDFIRDFKIDFVYSVLPCSEWPKVYPEIDTGTVKFGNVLTGYIDERVATKVYQKALKKNSRFIDISYRAWHAAFWLGRRGQLKVEIGNVVKNACKDRPLNVDISTEAADVVCGEQWYKFLMNSKCVLGVEGGASILDFDGCLKSRTEDYLLSKPMASFQEVENACFPGRDGELRGWAISPRHLEACFTRTCQILVEGEYNGILKPWIHYIPLKMDFSNLGEVLQMSQDPGLRQKITDRCYKDIVASGKYTYNAFVKKIFTEIFNNRQPKNVWNYVSDWRYGIHKSWCRLLWAKIPLRKATKSFKTVIKKIIKKRIGSDVSNTAVLVSVTSHHRDSRLRKFAGSLHRLGYRVIICDYSDGSKNPGAFFKVIPLGSVGNDNHNLNAIPGRLKLAFRRFAPKWVKALKNYFGFIARFVRDNVSAYRCLPVASAYLMTYYYYFPAVYLKAKRYGVKLIYDIRDYYIDLNNHPDPKNIVPGYWQVVRFMNAVERQTVKRSYQTVTVSHGLASIYASKFGRLPKVVRNCHSRPMDTLIECDIRAYLQRNFGVSKESFIIVSVGHAKIDATYDGVLSALKDLPNQIKLVFVGDGYEKRLSGSDRMKIFAERVFFIGAVEPDKLVPFIQGADAALILYYSYSKNNSICLPNRLFQAVSASLPIIYPDLPEISKTIDKCELGIKIDPKNESEVKKAIEELYYNPADRNRFKENAEAASSFLCWECEEKVIGELVQD